MAAHGSYGSVDGVRLCEFQSGIDLLAFAGSSCILEVAIGDTEALRVWSRGDD